MNSKLKLLCVVGARPNFMKIAPIVAAMRASPVLQPFLVHTGQHYDAAMKDAFFHQLGIPEPDVDLEVGSASHAVQTAEVMRRFEPVLDAQKPAGVVVVGDVNSTLACALVAAKKAVPVVHVEAGLRSFDRNMPEEINRVLTDQISDVLLTTERLARENLLREGIDEARIHFVGNVMIDTLLHNLPRAVPPAETLSRHRGRSRAFAGDLGRFALLTLHRPSNVDDALVLRRLLGVLGKLSERIPVIFPVHPRTEAKIHDAGLDLAQWPGMLPLPPVGYLEMLGLMQGARLVLTDSGGIQEETTALGVPCVTLRNNTERPITVREGTNTVVGTDPGRIEAVTHDILETGGKRGRVPELWDGRASERIVTTLSSWMARDGRAKMAC